MFMCKRLNRVQANVHAMVNSEEVVNALMNELDEALEALEVQPYDII